MDINEKISNVERKLSELSKPPADIPHSTVEIVAAHCESHGEYEQRVRTITGMIKIPPNHTECPGCLREQLDELHREREQIDAEARRRTIERLKLDFRVPERFADCTLDNYVPGCDDAKKALRVCQAYASKWPDRLKRGGGLVMCGKPGTGKNHLALAIAQHVIEKHQSTAVFTTALKIAREYKATWSKSATRSEDDVIRQFTRPDLLIIDEVGVQFGSEAEKLIMFEIINTRYERMRPTILISNQSKEELSAFIGERVIDRMNDGGGCTLAFTWDSYRGNRA
ncbi:AAA family ATPase [Jejubacter calystegiae]|uniref:AAA family ATPase n=1 Tax=Jejubacter calystegiae TaxID=2579935 RepID=A0A4P8YNI9_9ENTR|nr:ATP-binding protein [Jejubacter calystegiae]QCT21793.1 AAA family ATPase [Jejubacter calystegiae]